MPVEHKRTGIVHKGTKGGTTGCGQNTNDLPSHWVHTSKRVNCKKIGCK